MKKHIALSQNLILTLQDPNPLVKAIALGHPEEPGPLLAGPLTPKAVNGIAENGTTPLHAAIERNQLETVTRLINRGANPIGNNRAGVTAREAAAATGNPQLRAALNAGSTRSVQVSVLPRTIISDLVLAKAATFEPESTLHEPPATAPWYVDKTFADGVTDLYQLCETSRGEIAVMYTNNRWYNVTEAVEETMGADGRTAFSVRSRVIDFAQLDSPTTHVHIHPRSAEIENGNTLATAFLNLGFPQSLVQHCIDHFSPILSALPSPEDMRAYCITSEVYGDKTDCRQAIVSEYGITHITLEGDTAHHSDLVAQYTAMFEQIQYHAQHTLMNGGELSIQDAMDILSDNTPVQLTFVARQADQ